MKVERSQAENWTNTKSERPNVWQSVYKANCHIIWVYEYKTQPWTQGHLSFCGHRVNRRTSGGPGNVDGDGHPGTRLSRCCRAVWGTPLQQSPSTYPKLIPQSSPHHCQVLVPAPGSTVTAASGAWIQLLLPLLIPIPGRTYFFAAPALDSRPRASPSYDGCWWSHGLSLKSKGSRQTRVWCLGLYEGEEGCAAFGVCLF